jgi:hypothetical protein
MQAHDPGSNQERLELLVEPVKGIAKPYNGQMTPCRVCGKTCNEGDELWMQNLGDDTNKKWIVSPHEECFKKLQENPELGKSQNKKPFYQKKTRTNPERTDDTIAFISLMELKNIPVTSDACARVFSF